MLAGSTRQQLLALAALVTTAIVVLLTLLLAGGNDADDDDAGGTIRDADGTVRLEVYVHSAIADELDADDLLSAIEETVKGALKAEIVEIERRQESLLEAVTLRIRGLEEEAGYPEALERLGQLLEQRSDPDQDQLALLDAIDQAASEVTAAERAVVLRIPSLHPFVVFGDRVWGVELSPAPQHGAIRPDEAEQWIVVRVGVAFVIHDDAEAIQQAIANGVVQGLGLLAGLELREGSPSEAMTGELAEESELLDRDAGPVHFTDDERAQVRAALMMSE